MLLTGIFASSNFAGSNDSGKLIEGLLSGDATQLRLQATGALAAAVLASVGSLVVFGVVRLVTPGGWIHPDAPCAATTEQRPPPDDVSA
jgi:ammonia channel protein AmtB